MTALDRMAQAIYDEQGRRLSRRPAGGGGAPWASWENADETTKAMAYSFARAALASLAEGEAYCLGHQHATREEEK